jgi:hypothetical protein
MRNADIEHPRLVGRERGTGHKAGILAGVIAVAFAAIVVANLVSRGAVTVDSPETVTFSAAQQAEADRLTGLAEFMGSVAISEARAADAARWQARGEHYQMSRARQSEIDRLNGLTEHLGLAGLSQGQRAEADRLTRLAEHMGVAP